MRVAFVVPQPESSALRALNYSPAIEALRRGGTFGDSTPLGSLVVRIGASYGSVFTRRDCDPDFGIELLSQSDMFSSEPSGRVIRCDSMPDATKHQIQDGHVLLAGAGTLGETELYGRSIIADSRLVGQYVGPDAMVLEFLEPESDIALFAYAFLCTRAGIACVRATSYGTKILRFRSDLLQNIPVPAAPGSVVTRVADCVRKAILLRGKFASELACARKPIEELSIVQDALRTCRPDVAKCLVWDGRLVTLSAWNYASTGQALRLLQRRWSGRIRDVLSTTPSYGGRYSRISCEAPYGAEFLTQRDVFLIRRVLRRIVRPAGEGDDIYVSTGDILLAACGQIGEGNLFGRAEYADFGEERVIVTGDTLRLRTHERTAEVLFAFLSTRLGTLLLRGTAVGTSIPRMHAELLSNLPIPDITAQLQSEITSHVISSFSAKREANVAEAEAVRIIKEEVLPEWLA